MQGCFSFERVENVVFIQIAISFDKCAVTRFWKLCKVHWGAVHSPAWQIFPGGPGDSPTGIEQQFYYSARQVHHPTYQHSLEVKQWCFLLLIHYQITSQCLFRLLSLSQWHQVIKTRLSETSLEGILQRGKFSGQECKKCIALHSKKSIPIPVSNTVKITICDIE